MGKRPGKEAAMAAAGQTAPWPDSLAPSDVATSPLVERVRRGVIGEGELMDGPFGPRRWILRPVRATVPL